LIILAILFGMLGATACLAPGTGQGVAHPASVVMMADSGNSSYSGLTADSGQVFWASVAWNRGVRNNRDVRRSVAWN
jgi:hypothetical protein